MVGGREGGYRLRSSQSAQVGAHVIGRRSFPGLVDFVLIGHKCRLPHILVVRSFAGGGCGERESKGKCEGILLPFTGDGVSLFLGCSADGYVCSVLPRKRILLSPRCSAGERSRISEFIDAGGSVICLLLLPYSFHLPLAHPATRPPVSRVTILLSILLYLFPGRDLCLREANGQSRLL